MYLLNRSNILNYLESNPQFLNIIDFQEENIQHTFYYFRLGKISMLNGQKIPSSTQGNKSLLLLPGDYAIVQSIEKFILSDKVFGLFGQSSDLFAQGLLLNHSPFVDPLFNGYLTLGLSNITKNAIEIELTRQILGKISFFDIADSHPISLLPNSIISKKYANKKSEMDDESLHADYSGGD